MELPNYPRFPWPASVYCNFAANKQGFAKIKQKVLLFL
jgi:hypothetical protein